MSMVSAFSVVALGVALMSDDVLLEATAMKLTLTKYTRAHSEGAVFGGADVRYIERGYAIHQPVKERTALDKVGDFSKGFFGAVGNGLRAASAPVVGVAQRVRSHKPERPQSAPERYAQHPMDSYSDVDRLEQAKLEKAKLEQARREQAQLEHRQRLERERIDREAEIRRRDRVEQERRNRLEQEYAARNAYVRKTAKQNGILSGRKYSWEEIEGLTREQREILTSSLINGRTTDKHTSKPIRLGESEYDLWKNYHQTRTTPTGTPRTLEHVRVWE